MSEEEFIKKAIQAVTELTNEIVKLKRDSIVKEQCYVKACELTAWLDIYRGYHEEKKDE